MLSVFFVAGIALVVYEIKRFQKMLGTDLKKAKKNGYSTGRQEKSIEENYKLLQEGIPDGPVRERIKQVYDIARQKQSLQGLPETVNDVFPPTDDNNLYHLILTHINKALLITGLAGMVLGLARFAYELQIIAGKETLANSPFSYKPLEEGFGILFWGLLFAVLFQGALIVYKWYRNRFVAELNRFSSSRLYPLFNPLPEEKEFARLIETVSANTHRINAVSRNLESGAESLKMTYEQAHQFSSNLHGSIHAFIEAQANLHQDITNLTEAVRSFSTQHKSNEELMNALSLHNISIDQIHHKLQETQFHVGDWLKEMLYHSTEQQNNFRQNLEQLIELTRTNQRTTNEAVIRFSNTINKFENSMAKLQGHLENFNKAIELASQNEIDTITALSIKLNGVKQALDDIKNALPIQLARMDTGYGRRRTGLQRRYGRKQRISFSTNKILPERTSCRTQTRRTSPKK